VASDLSRLREIPAARARLDASELELIDRARRDGATWAEIAEALGLTSRQSAEQRRLRLAASVRPVRSDLDQRYGQTIADLREAAVALHRRIGADRRWDRRFRRAELVRETLAAAPEAPVSGLYSLVFAVMGDLDQAGATFPAPTASAIARLRDALEAASPQT
jgi:hypothetical protein